MTNGQRFETPHEGRQSITPTGRRPSEISRLNEGSLSTITTSQSSPNFPARNRSDSIHGTLHRRQPAENNDFDDSIPDLIPRPSPRRPATMSFSDDVAGIFDLIAQSDPSKELGLPPDSLRVRSLSHDFPSTSKSRFPADLGRSLSTDTPSRGNKQLVVPGSIAQRTSSLPSNGSSRPNGSPNLSRRVTSSPSSRPLDLPDPIDIDDKGLLRPTLSRSSSTSSRRRTNTHSPKPSPKLAKLGPPLPIENGDFGPSAEKNDATIKGRQTDPSPLLPSSVRLITTPKVDSISDFLSNSDSWTRDGSSRPETPVNVLANKDLPPDPHRTPGRNDENGDEERGRRLACEFLDDDFSSIPLEKVAEFIGGP